MHVAEKNAVVLFLARIMGLAISVLNFVVIPGVLGAEAYGYYAFWFSQLFLLQALLDIGASETLKRYLPEYFANDSGESRSLVVMLVIAKCLVLPVIAVIVFLHDDKVVFITIVIASFAAIGCRMLTDIAYAASWMLRVMQYELLRKIARILLVIIGFFSFGLPGVIGALLLTELIAFGLFYFGTKSAIFPQRQTLPRSASSYLSFGLLTSIATLLIISVGKLPVVIAKQSEISYADIGRYALVVDIGFFAFRELFYSIAEALQPQQVVQYAEAQHDKIVNSMRLSVSYVSLLLLPALILIGVYRIEFLSLVGEDYLSAADHLLYYLFISYVITLAWLYRQVLIITERKQALFGAALAAFLVFVLVLLTTGYNDLNFLTIAVFLSSVTLLVVIRWQTLAYLPFEGEILLLGRIGICAALFYFLISSSRALGPVHGMFGIVGAAIVYVLTLFLLRVVGQNEWNAAKRVRSGIGAAIHKRSQRDS